MKDEMARAAEWAAVKSAPPVAVVAASVAGWSVQEWMYAGTLGYVVLQAGYLVWKWYREWHKSRSEK